MQRFCFLFFLTTLLLRCNNIQKNASNQIQKETELQLNNAHRLRIATTVDTTDNRVTKQNLSFWEDNNQIKEISPTKLNFVNKPKSCYVSQVAKLTFGQSTFYLCYLYIANGEPEYFVIFSPKGELIAYKVCRKDDCQTTIEQINSQPKELINFFQADTITIDLKYKDVF